MQRHRVGRVWLAAWAGCFLVFACGKSPSGGAKKIPREGDAQPVVVVEAPGAREVSFADEVEPNNEPDQAQVLTPGTGVRGRLDGETDVDLYALAVNEAGFLNARLSGIDEVDLILELRDSEGKVLVHSDRGPAKTVEGLPNARVEAGEYRLAVREFVKKQRRRKKRRKNKDSAKPQGRVGPSPVYELVAEVSAGPEPHHESEPNSTADQAAEVLIGDEVFGYMGWNKDVDIWKLSVEGFSADYSLDLDIDGVPGVTLDLAVLDGSGKAVIERQGQKGSGLSVRNLVVVPREDLDKPAAGKGDKDRDPPRYFYAKLHARRSSPVDRYRLRMATRLMEPDQETEPNDDADSAVHLGETADTDKGTRRGFLTIGDVDHYRITAGDEPMLLWVSVKPDAETAALGLEVSVSVAGQSLGKARARGGEHVLADMRIEAKKTAIIEISGKGGLAADAAYGLRWSVEPAAGAPVDSPAPDLDDEVDVLDEYETE